MPPIVPAGVVPARRPQGSAPKPTGRPWPQALINISPRARSTNCTAAVLPTRTWPDRLHAALRLKVPGPPWCRTCSGSWARQTLLRVLSAPGDRQSAGFGPGGDRIPAACPHARPPSSATPLSSRQWEAGSWTESPGRKYRNVLEPEFRSDSSPIPRPGSFCRTAGDREPQHRQSKEPDNGLRNGRRRPGKNCTVRLFGRTLLPSGLPKVRL